MRLLHLPDGKPVSSMNPLVLKYMARRVLFILQGSRRYRIHSLASLLPMLAQLVLILFPADHLNSQPASTVDVFPLGIHYTWDYSYQTFKVGLNNFGEGSTEIDSGFVRYTITDSSSSGDTISWNIHTTWNLLVHYSENYPPTFDTTYSDVDSGNFVLWEMTFGNHPLAEEEFASPANLVWKFTNVLSDSAKIFRYQLVDSQGISVVNTVFNGYSGFDIPLQFIFKRDSGLTRLDGEAQMEHSGVGVHCVLLKTLLTSVEQRVFVGLAPLYYHLDQNYPNPFNPSTTISYSLPQKTFVTLELYDLLGREVRTLVNSEQEPGNYSRIVDANELPSGVYFYRLRAGNFSDVKKMLVLK